jgi:hypothetical protein
MHGSQQSSKPPSLPADLDLEIYTEATRRALYDIVVAVHFTAPPKVARGDWFPAYTPDQAGLEVHFTVACQRLQAASKITTCRSGIRIQRHRRILDRGAVGRQAIR